MSKGNKDIPGMFGTVFVMTIGASLIGSIAILPVAFLIGWLAPGRRILLTFLQHPRKHPSARLLPDTQ